jgi:hypothetical protein
VTDLSYCPIIIGVPCLAPEAWAAWAQAILSAAAIYFAELAATAPDKLAKRRKASSYLALLDIAESILGGCIDQRPSVIMSARLRQITGQFAEVNVENIPDYRLLKPMQETHSALAIMQDIVDRELHMSDMQDRARSDYLRSEMSTTYRDLLRARRPSVAAIVEEIVPENWFTRLARKIRKG